MTTPLDPFFAGDDEECDPLLGQLLQLPGARWRITVVVAGREITGTVVHPLEYLRLLDEQVAKYDTEMGSVAGHVRHGLGTSAPQLDDLDDRDDRVTPRWVHLAGARSVEDGALHKIGLWRGRTSLVAGWTLRSPGRHAR